MSVQQELNNMRNLIMQIKDLRDRMDALAGSVCMPSIVPSLSGPSAPQNHDSICAYVAEREQIMIELVHLMGDRQRQYSELEADIYRLPHRQCQIIRAKYILGESWKCIASDMHYSIQRCYQIHTAALRNLENIRVNLNTSCVIV